MHETLRFPQLTISADAETATLHAVQTLCLADEALHLSDKAQHSLAVLYARFSAPMGDAGRRLLGDEGLDVVHEVFLELPRLLRQYRGGALLPWLRRIVVTRCLMRLRRRRRFVEGELPKDAVSLEDPALLVERDLVVREALNQLPEPLRQVVVLRYFLSLSHREIAALLEISPTASELRLFRAMKQLRNAFDEPARGSRRVA